MNEPSSQDLLNASLRRCLDNSQFFPIFYEYFQQSSPEVADLFAKTDMNRLNNMMQSSLYRIIAASESNWESDQDLVEIAESHKNMNIKSEFYKYWELSLLATVAECDPEYNEQTRKAWKDILSRGISFMANY